MEKWIKGEDYPAWGDNRRIQKDYIRGIFISTEKVLEKHTRESLERLLVGLYKPEMAETFFNYIWNGWLCLG